MFNCFHSLQYWHRRHFFVSGVIVVGVVGGGAVVLSDLNYRYTIFFTEACTLCYVSGSLIRSSIKFHYFEFDVVDVTLTLNLFTVLFNQLNYEVPAIQIFNTIRLYHTEWNKRNKQTNKQKTFNGILKSPLKIICFTDHVWWNISIRLSHAYSIIHRFYLGECIIFH